jgi:hypothetical protein
LTRARLRAVSAIEVGQLLRSRAQFGEKAGDAGEGAASTVALAVRAGDRQRRASGMVGLPADRLEQQRPAGDRFPVRVGMRCVA